MEFNKKIKCILSNFSDEDKLKYKIFMIDSIKEAIPKLQGINGEKDLYGEYLNQSLDTSPDIVIRSIFTKMSINDEFFNNLRSLHPARFIKIIDSINKIINESRDYPNMLPTLIFTEFINLKNINFYSNGL